MELETHILIAQRLQYVGAVDVEPLFDCAGEVSRMLTGLTKKLQKLAPST